MAGALSASAQSNTRGLQAQHPAAATAGEAQHFLTPVVSTNEPLNDAKAERQHYVILVSLDGFRYDYPQKYGATHLLALGARGASTPTGMLPSYPSLTFPNHYTIVTGLYPEHTGIVDNRFWAPKLDATYVYKEAKSNQDGRFYSGVPLWSLAEQQHMRAASMFWPASEAEIAGHRPAYYLHFDDKLNDELRIDQIVQWLQLPPAERPHFITLYYANVDHAGHEFGPDSTQVRDAVHHVDQLVGDLESKVAALHMPVDIIVLADHGMAHPWDTIYLDQFADLKGVHFEGDLLYPKNDAEAQSITGQINSHHDDRFRAVRRADVPADLHYSENPREGDPLMIPNGLYEFRVHKTEGSNPNAAHQGEHGFDPHKVPEMKAIFFAAGPDIRPGTVLPTFENVDIYPFIAHILNLKLPAGEKLDGTDRPLAVALRHAKEQNKGHAGN
jgi:predicted AlkP superfamily pyrophosphatase or phosphodiesterase